MSPDIQMAERLLQRSMLAHTTLNAFRIDILRQLCQRYQLSIDATGKKGAVKADYVTALRQFHTAWQASTEVTVASNADQLHEKKHKLVYVTNAMHGRPMKRPRIALEDQHAEHGQKRAAGDDTMMDEKQKIAKRKKLQPKSIKVRLYTHEKDW
ncbi:hypothetical protein EW146_g7957 [Bondarzewia mesenterica]|uniref:Uncharacterized protein n=1 Tax=Bondarzewia mesenterica TaxID=1095465 RepID=A0A4S4LI39_9AGAM|nr:hypothetical protein EW146_g7957 [Bondarzewia mesenterica]